jgi:hypothetical protein
MNPPGLSDRQKFGLAIDCAWEAGLKRSLDWLTGGPPGSGADGFAYRLLVDAAVDHAKGLVTKLRWLDAEGHRMRGGANVAYDRFLSVTFARSAAAVGWIRHDEAWDWIDKASEALLQRYKNWGEFAVAFVEGLEGFQQRPMNGARRFISEEMLGQPKSPWHYIAWPGATYDDDSGLELDLEPRTFKPG